MSVDFIKKRYNETHIATAQRQQKQLSYFTQSEVQTEVTQAYLEQWVNRNFAGNDFFLTWMKTVLKTQNFLSFFKQMRNPIASSELINDDIIPQLKRVFHAEDSYFRYIVGNKPVEAPEFLHHDKFTEKLFNAILFNHNDIIVTDLSEVNKPYRDFVSINDVVSIESDCGDIKRIAYHAELKADPKNIPGFLYIDDNAYIFYNAKFEQLSNVPHDLGECPADYISSEAMGKSDVVRKSIFSYKRPALEEFVILRTIQKMTDLNGAIPVTTKMKTLDVSKNVDKNGESTAEPMSANSIGSQQAGIYADVNKSRSPNQPGTVIEVPTIKDDQGRINLDVIKNYLVFHYMPVEALGQLDERIQATRSRIISSLLGDYNEQNESAKNEMQVGKSYINKQDKLRWMALELTRIKKISDFKALALAYGRDRVETDQFFGSDFFLETASDLMKDFQIAPNSIIRRNLLTRLAQNTNKFNTEKAEREVILYKLIPFESDTDFKAAIEMQIVSDELKVYQIRFNHWISMFEASYGDLLLFYKDLGDSKDSEKLIYINNLIIDLIVANTEFPKKEEVVKQ